jgi:hypothetical protein
MGVGTNAATKQTASRSRFVTLSQHERRGTQYSEGA